MPQLERWYWFSVVHAFLTKEYRYQPVRCLTQFAMLTVVNVVFIHRMSSLDSVNIIK